MPVQYLTIEGETEARYLKDGGLHCPYCGTDEIEGYSIDIEGGEAWQEVSCLRCHASWKDVYTLTSLEPHNGPPIQEEAAPCSA